jgi:hypothetical protein
LTEIVSSQPKKSTKPKDLLRAGVRMSIIGKYTLLIIGAIKLNCLFTSFSVYSKVFFRNPLEQLLGLASQKAPERMPWKSEKSGLIAYVLDSLPNQ